MEKSRKDCKTKKTQNLVKTWKKFKTANAKIRTKTQLIQGIINKNETNQKSKFDKKSQINLAYFIGIYKTGSQPKISKHFQQF